MLHLRGVFVGVIHNLRLDKYVLLCRMLWLRLGNSVLLRIVLLQFVLLGRFLRVIQSFIIL
jgi:hypothetical protein